MPWELILIIAVPVYVWVWRLAFRLAIPGCLAWKDAPIDSNAVVCAAFGATFLFWLILPYALVGYIAHTWSERTDWAKLARSLGGETRQQRAARYACQEAEADRKLAEALDE